MADVKVPIPYNWNARRYQTGFMRRMALGLQGKKGGTKRGVLRWHRRSGKDEVCLHWTAWAALRRQGNYWHLLPEYGQARKAVWNAINPHSGIRRIDEAFPHEMRSRTREAEMFIEFTNGSTWQLVGSDNYDTLVGSPPVGLIFSEYALSSPLSWDYLCPMLAENGGWAVFNSTVRGRNHFWNLGEFAKNDPDWYFSEVDADATDVLSDAVLAGELRELQAIWGMEDGLARYRQEYFNDPNVAMPGAIYANYLLLAQQEGRIGNFPHDKRKPVHTAWDIAGGQSTTADETAIWFWQDFKVGPRFIDYYHSRGKGIEHYAGVLFDKPYDYGRHIAPHDIVVGEFGTGETRLETAAKFDIVFEVAPRLSINDGIQAARNLFPACRFNEKACSTGLEALASYHNKYDEEKRVLRLTPVHDWSEHGSSAFRYMAVANKFGTVMGAADGQGKTKDDWGY